MTIYVYVEDIHDGNMGIYYHLKSRTVTGGLYQVKIFVSSAQQVGT